MGFDYLRDNMAHLEEQKVQCSLDFAIVDEVDSILIDEARTPLVISGPSAESSDMYLQIKKIIPKLKLQLRPDDDENPLQDDEIGHYLIDEKNRTVELTDDGYVFVEQILDEMNLIGNSDGPYSVSNLKIMRFVQASLRANFLFKKKKPSTVNDDIKPGGRIRKKSSIKKMLAMRKLDVNSGLLETIAAKNTKRTFGPDQVCGVVCRGRI